MAKLAAVTVALGVGQMNPIPGGYRIGNALPGYESKQWSFRGSFFEVRTAEMETRYSEVFWTSLPDVPLPADIVAKFKDKNIVISGFEVDVKRMNNKTGVEESVPVFESYNHHYGPALVSSYAEMDRDEFGQPTGPDHGHGKSILFRVKPGVTPPPDAKLVENFVHGNGNEHRQIYHGTSAGFGQLIYSPANFSMVAMQINTNFNGSGIPGGPLPQFSREHAPPATKWNPLFECPCTSRISKQLGSLSSQLGGSCAKLPYAAADCFAGAAQAFGEVTLTKNVSVSSAELSPGCTVARVAEGSDDLAVTWNQNLKSMVPCSGGGGGAVTSAAGHTKDLVDMRVEVDAIAALVTITLAGPSAVWFGVGFNASAMQDEPYAIIVEATDSEPHISGTVSERKLADHAPGTALPPSIKLISSSVSSGVRTLITSDGLCDCLGLPLSASDDHLWRLIAGELWSEDCASPARASRRIPGLLQLLSRDRDDPVHQRCGEHAQLPAAQAAQHRHASARTNFARTPKLPLRGSRRNHRRLPPERELRRGASE